MSSITDPSSTSNKVDWRNYDYSEGPPKPSLVYRPAKPITTTIDTTNTTTTTTTVTPTRKEHLSLEENDHHHHNEDEEDHITMSIPKVNKYTEISMEEEEDIKVDEILDEPIAKVVTPKRDELVNDQEEEKKDKKKEFEKVWQEENTVEDLENDVTEKLDVSTVVSNDIDDEELVGEDEPMEKYEEDVDTNIRYDDFAGDLSKTSTTQKNYCSDDSVGKMDVTMAVAPVSILKNGKFESISRGCSAASVSSNHSELESNVAPQDVSANESTPKRRLERRGVEESYDEKDIKEDDVNEEDADEDTIFDFKRVDVNKTKGKQDKSRQNDDDDTSIDDVGKSLPQKRADTLKDRTKQAWSARNRATAAAVTNTDAAVEKRDRVSFRANDTIREFTPDSQEEDSYSSAGDSEEDDDTYTEYTEYTEFTEMTGDDDTFAGRSMHSVYTKSNESETEDIIKDFLLIGRGQATNPGRRQLKYKKGRKEIYEQMKKEKVRLPLPCFLVNFLLFVVLTFQLFYVIKRSNNMK